MKNEDLLHELKESNRQLWELGHYTDYNAEILENAFEIYKNTVSELIKINPNIFINSINTIGELTPKIEIMLSPKTSIKSRKILIPNQKSI